MLIQNTTLKLEVVQGLRYIKYVILQELDLLPSSGNWLADANSIENNNKKHLPVCQQVTLEQE
jgi:hypothetical protein